MLNLKSLAVCGLLAASTVSAQTYVYKFDGKDAAGVDGMIKVQYASPRDSKATISADLDFSKVNMTEIQAFDSNCVSEITEYKWHIHVKWSSSKRSDKLGQCSKAATSNHYDPLKACGPNSEYAETTECVAKIPNYKCNPTTYAANWEVCEKGDLSGKFGGLKLDANKKAKGEWVDVHYPLESESTPQWNMILHGVCGTATPRIACAIATREDRGQC